MTLDDMRYNLKKIEEGLYLCCNLIDDELYKQAIDEVFKVYVLTPAPAIRWKLSCLSQLLEDGNPDEAKKELMKIIGE